MPVLLNGKIGSHASAAWLETLGKILSNGDAIAPRGMRTLELQHHTLALNMSYPVVLCPARKLSYTFAAAEALWILAGDDRVATIAPYNPNIAQFSDDGVVFAGAYGAPIVAQFEYVVDALLRDRETRQAVMTIWRPNPAPSKDIPCTVALAFAIRGGQLNCHAFMRSSDAWLGVPYDVFNFSMLSAKIACAYNAAMRDRPNPAPDGDLIELGWLRLTAVSSHLYKRNCAAAAACLNDDAPLGEPIPRSWIRDGDWESIEVSLLACRDKADLAFIDATETWRIRP